VESLISAEQGTMKAIVHEQYGPDGIALRDVDVPTIEDHQVLLHVHASSVNPADWYGVHGPIFARFESGLRKPKSGAAGTDVAGRIEAVGKDVTEFQPGDEVFGTCLGAWAENARGREARLVHKPENVSFEEAGAVAVAALTALQALRDHGEVQAGQKVLINGASGGVGTYAVQLAKAFGADVTAVCSTRNVEQTASLGADRVCDYTREDFTKIPVRHDLAIDIAGSMPIRRLARVLTPEAPIVIVGAGGVKGGLGPLPHIVATYASGLVRRRKVAFFIAKINKEDLLVMRELLASGKVRSVVDRTYDLSQVSEALRYLGQGHARGKIVITM
jgi:NADPH:quinone reductase-like Zn-dependent oxidoreductase